MKDLLKRIEDHMLRLLLISLLGGLGLRLVSATVVAHYWPGTRPFPFMAAVFAATGLRLVAEAMCFQHKWPR